MATKVISCNCRHKAQDEIYGVGRRVMNETKQAKGDRPTYRCTVCGAEKSE